MESKAGYPLRIRDRAVVQEAPRGAERKIPSVESRAGK